MKAATFNRLYGIEIDELKSEGNLIFVKALNSFDGNRASFSSFLWRCLDNGLHGFCGRQKKQMFFDYSDDGVLPPGRTDDHIRMHNKIFIQQSIAMLPTIGKQAICLFMQNPRALGLTGNEPPKAIRGALRKYIRGQGEGWAVTWQTLREIKNIYQKML